MTFEGSHRRQRGFEFQLEHLEDKAAPAGLPSLLNDVFAGSGHSHPVEFTEVGGVAYFAAGDPVHGEELWKTDGTMAGTVLVKDINVGAAASGPRLLTAVGNLLYFVATDGVNGRELWKSEGTAAGTVMVENLSSGSANSANIRHPLAAGGKFYFTMGDDQGRELWVSDGTAPGTKRVKDIRPGGGNAIDTVAFMTAFNGNVYFVANDGIGGAELWKSDGTTAGTVQVLDLVAGIGDSDPRNLTAIGSHLYFSCGADVYRTNGNVGNVEQLTQPQAGATRVGWIAAASGTVYFARVQVSATPAEIWKSDGSQAGTVPVAALPLGGVTGNATNPGLPTALDHRLQFAFDDGVHGVEPWVTDGTAAGTFMLRDVRPGTASGAAAASGIVSTFGALQVVPPPASVRLHELNTSTPVLFQERTGVLMLDGTLSPNANGVGLYNSTGDLNPLNVPIGTHVDSYYLHFDPVGNPPDLNSAGSITFEREILGVFCREGRLDSSDPLVGRPATQYPTGLNYRQIDLDEDADNFTISADRRTIVFDFYTSDNTDDMRIITRSATPAIVIDGAAYFAGNDGQSGVELWRTDGTAAGTQLVADLDAGSANGFLGSLSLLGSRVYFRGQQTTTGAEPWLLEAAAPAVSGVWLDRASWTESFRTAMGGPLGFPAPVGSGQFAPLPWTGIDRIRIQFSEPVTVDAADLRIAGLNQAAYPTNGFAYDPATRTATWQLAAGLPTDRVLLDLDGDSATAVVDLAGNPLAGDWSEGADDFPSAGLSGSDFQYRFVVAVGDVDRNALVRNGDLNIVRNNLFVDAGVGGYNIFADIDGNGQIRNADVNQVRSQLFVDPPTGPGPFRPGRDHRSNSRADRLFTTPMQYRQQAFNREHLMSWIRKPMTTARRLARGMHFQALDVLFSEG